jgi:[ribosomal protein S18]-alanine N-acetyltransferase
VTGVRPIGPAVVRPTGPADAEALLGIQAESPEIAQWTKRAYERLAESETAGWAAEASGRLCGFILARQAGGDIEILNFAVGRDMRGRGVGALLLDEVLAWAKSTRAEKIYLEVRSSNRTARNFYERHGFAETGRRPRYYSAPVEDAILLALSTSAGTVRD